MNLRNAIASILLASCSTAYGEPGHDIRDHDELMNQSFCVAALVFSAQQNPPVLDIPEQERRATHLAMSMLSKARQLGHDSIEAGEMLAEITLKMHGLQVTDWLRFVEYIDCRGMTDRYATAYWN